MLLLRPQSVKLEDLASVCSVKFRYSVLAGPAPFEWIARAQQEVAIEQVVNWYDAYFQTAVLNLKFGRVNMGDATGTIESLEKYRACMKQFPVRPLPCGWLARKGGDTVMSGSEWGYSH